MIMPQSSAPRACKDNNTHTLTPTYTHARTYTDLLTDTLITKTKNIYTETNTYAHALIGTRKHTRPSPVKDLPEGRAVDGVVPGVGAVVGHGIELVQEAAGRPPPPRPVPAHARFDTPETHGGACTPLARASQETPPPESLAKQEATIAEDKASVFGFCGDCGGLSDSSRRTEFVFLVSLFYDFHFSLTLHHSLNCLSITFIITSHTESLTFEIN